MFNDKSKKVLRRKLRNNLSPVEVLLWARLKGKQINGKKFRRQYGVGPYVLDFYCSSVRLGIEVDGEHHFLSQDQIERDKQRDTFIEKQGIRILHVTGKDVNENMEGVVSEILRYLKI